MYGFSKTFPIDVFINKELEQISFSTNHIVLFFNEELSISIESSFSLGDLRHIGIIRRIPLKQTNLIKLIGLKVLRANIEDNFKTLCLTFSNGEELRLYDDSIKYESLKIKINEEEIFI